jgi:uncharacterized membrane protein YkoI
VRSFDCGRQTVPNNLKWTLIGMGLMVALVVAGATIAASAGGSDPPKQQSRVQQNASPNPVQSDDAEDRDVGETEKGEGRGDDAEGPGDDAEDRDDVGDRDDAGEDRDDDRENRDDVGDREDDDRGEREDDDGEDRDGDGDGEERVSGPTSERARSIALREAGGGTVDEVERGDDGNSGYEVEVTRPDGSSTEVELDGSLKVLSVHGDD